MRTTIGLRTIATTLAAVLLLASPIAADTERGDTGAVGRHHLIDTLSSPGARCTYVDAHGDMVLRSITVRPPIIFARDRTPAHDGQMVGWRIQLLAWVPDHDQFWTYHLVQLAAGPVHRAWATDVRAAAFRPDTMVIGQPARGYRIRIRMTWSRPGTPTELDGWSRHLVDRYAVAGSTPWEECMGIVH